MDNSNNRPRIPFPIMRSWEQTPTNELMHVGAPINNSRLTNLREIHFEISLAKWKKNPSLENAINILNCTNFTIKNEIPEQALSQIVNSNKVTNTLKEAVKSIIDPTLENLINKKKNYLEIIRSKIHSNRLRLGDENRNGMLYAEIGRLYATLGENELAKKYFHMACLISPYERFILRNYTRFMLHVGDAEILKILTKSDLLKSDAWVQATEIGISTHFEIGSEVANSALRSVSRNQVGINDQSELAIALSVLEFNSGNIRKSKKLINKSAHNPSFNAIAQIMWNKNKRQEIYDKSIETTEFNDNLLKSDEALVYNAIISRKWDDAINNIIEWQDKQLYSSFVAMEGSFIAISFANDFEKAIQICDNGMIANSKNPILLNNICYSHQMLGNISEANYYLEELKKIDPNWEKNIFNLATDAKQKYLEGRITEGRLQFQSAIKMARAAENSELIQRVKMHMLQEESLSGKINNSEIRKGVKYLEDTIKNFDSDYVDDYWYNVKERIDNQIKKNERIQSQNFTEKLDPNFYS